MQQSLPWRPNSNSENGEPAENGDAAASRDADHGRRFVVVDEFEQAGMSPEGMHPAHVSSRSAVDTVSTHELRNSCAYCTGARSLGGRVPHPARTSSAVAVISVTEDRPAALGNAGSQGVHPALVQVACMIQSLEVGLAGYSAPVLLWCSSGR